MFLSKDTFATVIENTPLISIDLVVLNKQGHALLGQRLNRPAKHFWFVPGGRILKDEAMADAFKRLTYDELGTEYSIDQAELLGPFDHFYSDNLFGETFSTHYIAIAYLLRLESELHNLPLNIQHDRYRWFDIGELKVDSEVHLHTKWYFTTQAFSQ